MTAKKMILISLVVILLLGIGGTVLAAAVPEINWFVFSGGATRVTGSNGLVLTGSLGQTAIGVSSAPPTGLSSGYLAAMGEQLIFIPSVKKP